MNILVVAPDLPWPATTGGRIRNAAFVAALATQGDVDLFTLVGPNAPVPHDPTGAVARLQVTPRPERRRRRLEQARWMATGRLPWSLSDRDWRRARAEFVSWARPRYDLAWILGSRPYPGFRDLITDPLIVDLEDLEDWKIAARESSRRQRPSRATVLVRLNRRRWGALHRRITATSDAVTVCSELDRERLAAPNAAVVPNSYAVPSRPAGHIEVRSPPTLLLVGLFTYPPNIDAAHYFVRDILPKLQASVPDVQLRLVGDHHGEIAALADVPGVVVTGFVPDITGELERADAVVVPVRFGSGTRVKILEAFAHRIPVVATPAACEGLDVGSGTHLMIASTPEDFASACHITLTNPQRRAQLVAAAEELYRKRYTTDAVAAVVREVATRVGRRSI